MLLKSRLREAEGRLAAADQDVTQVRKLVTFVRVLSDSYQVQLAVIPVRHCSPGRIAPARNHSRKRLA